MKLRGVLALHNGLLCKKEALDAYSATIGGEKVDVHFPAYNQPADIEHSCGMMNPMLPPDGFEGFKRDNRMLEWGYPRDYPAGDCEVLHLAFVADCKEEKATLAANAIYEDIDRWNDRFLKYCFLYNKQITAREWVESNSYQFFRLFQGNTCIPPAENVINMTLSVAKPESFLSKDQIQKAVDFASSDRELLFEYELLLKAYQEYGKGNDRYAILDAASALEHCLFTQIENMCVQHDIVPELILKKYRTLGERFKAVQSLDPSFSIKDIESTVVVPRNSIMHNGNVEIDSKTAFELLKKTDEILHYFYNDFYVE